MAVRPQPCHAPTAAAGITTQVRPAHNPSPPASQCSAELVRCVLDRRTVHVAAAVCLSRFIHLIAARSHGYTMPISTHFLAGTHATMPCGGCMCIGSLPLPSRMTVWPFLASLGLFLVPGCLSGRLVGGTRGASAAAAAGSHDGRGCRVWGAVCRSTPRAQRMSVVPGSGGQGGQGGRSLLANPLEIVSVLTPSPTIGTDPAK